ncbi:MAG: class I SAM-dependent methyltransferase [Candidatus Bipolaricaulis sp.]|nr:class I SAM-dependent methyltransferase [Candidatus Bipolaricaulis sp.]
MSDSDSILPATRSSAKPQLARGCTVVYRNRMAPRERYGRRAARIYAGAIDPALHSLRSAVTRICREEGATPILDIACATGAQCRRLAQAGIRVTGVDLSESMLAAARRRSTAGMEFIHASALDLPFRDASFGGVLLSLALHEHAEEERERMLREALRVLRPGGFLLVADFSRPAHTGLHIPWAVIRLIEATAGPEHRTGFRDFVQRGSLEGFLSRHGLAPSRTARAVLGAVVIAVVRRPTEVLPSSPCD